jgi:hypothetical protein
MRVETRQKLESEKTRVYAHRPRLKLPFKISISGLQDIFNNAKAKLQRDRNIGVREAATISIRETVYVSWKSICSDSNRFTATSTFFKRKKCAMKTMQVLACPTDEVSLNNASRP